MVLLPTECVTREQDPPSLRGAPYNMSKCGRVRVSSAYLSGLTTRGSLTLYPDTWVGGVCVNISKGGVYETDPVL